MMSERGAAAPGPFPAPTLLPNTQQPHLLPRRPPAHRSVSLRHTPPLQQLHQRPSSRPQSSQAQPETQQQQLRHLHKKQAHAKAPETLLQQLARKTSGESSDEQHAPAQNNQRSNSDESSNADQWFEKSNNNVKRNTTTANEHTPPFYFQNSSNDSPEDGDRQGVMSTTLPIRLGQVHEQSLASSSEEYRSVIDDLTIQNKKLKKRLKQYQRFDSPHLQSDKLFEIRFHGLTGAQRRELEETLHKFTSGLGADGKHQVLSKHATMQAHDSASGAKPESSQFADSGYGSMATSAGLGSTSRTRSAQSQTLSQSQTVSQSQTTQSRARENPYEALEARDKSIRSYLHDIPAGLLPRPAAVMSEKSKKKLVVRRLEQVFAGRGAAAGGHQQPLQQQEVSRLAASDDRKASEAKGELVAAEGPREARIMQIETEDPMDLQADGAKSASTANDVKMPVRVEDHSAGSSPGPNEQRPTRPLDLDLHRAQIATENIEYIRHLGFTLMDTRDPRSQTEQGWLYLNLLVNMAQVHTLNVTNTFVRAAIAEFSQKLTLSKDGRKVRWSGGTETTTADSRTGSSSGAECTTPGSADPVGSEYNTRKRERPDHVEEFSSPQQSGVVTKKTALTDLADQSFVYKPLFPRAAAAETDSEDSSAGDSDNDDDSDETVDSSPLMGDHTNAESSYFQSTARQVSNSGKRNTDGPLIFFNNAKFCVDLSGDAGRLPQPSRTADYQSFARSPLGEAVPPRLSSIARARVSDSPLYRAVAVGAPSSPGSTESDQSHEGIKFPNSSPKHVTFAEPPQPISFAASGIGGVSPRDNIAVHVLRRHTVISAKTEWRRSSSRLTQPLPRVISPLGIDESIISTSENALEPSSLPPASYAYMDVDHDVDDMEEDDGDDEAEFVNTSPNHLRLASAISDHDDSDSDNESISSTAPEAASVADDAQGAAADDDDDQSIDFLAQARSVDPAAIHAREREYDADMAERLAEDIPAGSSAATAGGGSGFNSPADVIGQDSSGQPATHGYDGNEEDGSDELKSSVSS